MLHLIIESNEIAATRIDRRAKILTSLDKISIVTDSMRDLIAASPTFKLTRPLMSNGNEFILGGVGDIENPYAVCGLPLSHGDDSKGRASATIDPCARRKLPINFSCNSA